MFVLEHLKPEAPFLREKPIKGEIDGTQYEGDCACLIDSLGNANGGIETVCKTIPFYDKGLHNYVEQWFYQIRQGDTPGNSAFAKRALTLIDMALNNNN